jgi:tRNA pseudouridine13 synthase
MSFTGDALFSWPRTAPPPCASAMLRASPEDFVVEERLPFTLSGAGEHLWLKVRKRGLNTDQAAGFIARTAGVKRRDVGYAGMKDRHAVTVQWFSVYLPGRADPDWAGRLPAGCEILEARRHARKLHTGAHAGNTFTIVLRDCIADREALASRVETIQRRGLPNYFGEQRFGHGGENIARARAMFAGVTIHDRHKRGIYLSAARSFLFNAGLARRVTDGSWDRPLDGEVFILDGTRSFFLPEKLDETIARRLREHDIHPSGPLWGAGELPTRGAARALEQAIADTEPALVAGLAQAGLKQERRALRLIPADLRAVWLDAASLRLEFALPSGTFATALLRELADYRDVAGMTPET